VVFIHKIGLVDFFHKMANADKSENRIKTTTHQSSSEQIQGTKSTLRPSSPEP
jgi:hypothetical protein